MYIVNHFINQANGNIGETVRNFLEETPRALEILQIASIEIGLTISEGNDEPRKLKIQDFISKLPSLPENYPKRENLAKNLKKVQNHLFSKPSGPAP